MKVTVFMFTVAIIVFGAEGRKLNRCEIVRELRSHGFPEDKMRDWVCLVENESRGRTHIISPVNGNGSRDYGFFQINDKYWCSNNGSSGKDCNLTCEDVTTDDITKASQCAKKVFKRHGFSAWRGWLNHCQGALPDISNC